MKEEGIIKSFNEDNKNKKNKSLGFYKVTNKGSWDLKDEKKEPQFESEVKISGESPSKFIPVTPEDTKKNEFNGQSKWDELNQQWEFFNSKAEKETRFAGGKEIDGEKPGNVWL